MEPEQYETMNPDEIQAYTRYHGEIVSCGDHQYGILINGKVLMPEAFEKILPTHEGFKIDFAMDE